MAQFTHEILPGVTGVTTAEGVLADVYRRDPTYTEVLDDSDVEELKGKALDQALREARLPTTGTAAEKRGRLAGVAAAQQPPEGFDKVQLAREAQTSVVEDPDTAAQFNPGGTLDRDATQNEEN